MFENHNQDVTLENDNDTLLVDPLDADALKAELTTTVAKKKAWRDKFQKTNSLVGEKDKTISELQEKLSKYEQPTPTNGVPEKKELPPKSEAPDAEWLFENIDTISGLSPIERTELRQTAKELGVDPVKYIKSRAGQAELSAFRAKAKSDGATPPSSYQVPTFNGKPMKDIFTSDKATPSEKQAAYEARIRGTGSNQSI